MADALSFMAQPCLILQNSLHISCSLLLNLVKQLLFNFSSFILLLPSDLLLNLSLLLRRQNLGLGCLGSKHHCHLLPPHCLFFLMDSIQLGFPFLF
jgi:hypothetical protein